MSAALDFAESRRVIAEHSKSFSLASRLFPREHRDRVSAIYAWCRSADDAIDLAPPHEHAHALAGERARLASLYAGEPQADAVSRAFQHTVRELGIPAAYPSALLDGMEMDAGGFEYDDLDALLLYSYRVASTVGLMTCHVMGISDERATPHAAHLGIAMQLTNICRDVLEDWRLGRVYVPAELLSADLNRALRERRGGELPAPLPEKAVPELASAARRLLDLADRYYASADRGMAYLAPRSALAVRTARLVYAEIGSVIRERDCDVLAGRAVVPTRRKLALVSRALRAFARERASRERRRLVVRPPEHLLEAPEAVRLPA